MPCLYRVVRRQVEPGFLPSLQVTFWASSIFFLSSSVWSGPASIPWSNLVLDVVPTPTSWSSPNHRHADRGREPHHVVDDRRRPISATYCKSSMDWRTESTLFALNQFADAVERRLLHLERLADRVRLDAEVFKRDVPRSGFFPELAVVGLQRLDRRF